MAGDFLMDRGSAKFIMPKVEPRLHIRRRRRCPYS